MARRGIALILTLFGAVLLMAATAFVVLYFVVGREPAVPRSATLTIRLGSELAEVPPDDVFSYLGATRTPTVRAIVDNLRKASVDDRIHAVMLKTGGFTTPYWGKIQEIRNAILEFKESGKPVYAYLEFAGDRDYYLASAADQVFLMPSSSVDLTGIATYELFLRGTLDKIGAYADLRHVGAYKTAVNQFTETGFTDTHREMSESLNHDLFDQIVRGVAEGRNKSEDEVRAIIDRGPLLAADAFEVGLVDHLAYEDQVEEVLRTGEEESELADTRDVSGRDYERVSLSSLGLNRGPRIALIYVAGTIMNGQSRYDPVNGPVVGSDTLIEYIRRATRDDSIRAVVVRIDSPGGSATASDAVWHELQAAKTDNQDRPIVASMSDLAASGGYYIAMGADAIVAQPSTLTGSIGIFGGKFVTGGVYERLGANIGTTSVGAYAEMNSPARPYNEAEGQKLQDYLQAFYDDFVEKAAASRQTTPGQIDRVAQGRVWTGRQALENGLVDELGGLDVALALAKERAGIDSEREVQLVVYPPRRNLYEVLSDQLARGGAETAISRWLAANFSATELEGIRALRGPLGLFRRGEALALMPFTFLR
jgi:protease-4